MRERRSRGDRRQAGLRLEVATLWAMERHGHVTHCALIRLLHAWELRVEMDDDLLLFERCRTETELFAIARGWRERLRERGWSDPSAAAPVIEAAEVWRAADPS
jgi:hypothetical protein